MIFTKEMLDQVFANAIIRAAKSIVADGDLTGFLREEIVKVISVSPAHLSALTGLMSAYQAWYDFHLKIYNEGRSGNLTPAETTQLGTLIDQREAAKDRFLAIT